jgi:hypothetical protein
MVIGARDSRLGLLLGLWVAVVGCSARIGFGDEAGSSTADSGSTDETSGTVEPSPNCELILQEDGTPSGFEQCMNNTLFRISAPTCIDPHPAPSEGLCQRGCVDDDDCEDAPFGVCWWDFSTISSCRCVYGCTNDADCGSGFACMCAPVDQGTRCIDAACRTDADCSAGYRCELTPTVMWGAPPNLFCYPDYG